MLIIIFEPLGGEGYLIFGFSHPGLDLHLDHSGPMLNHDITYFTIRE